MADYNEIHSGGKKHFQQQDMGKWGYGVSGIKQICDAQIIKSIPVYLLESNSIKCTTYDQSKK